MLVRIVTSILTMVDEVLSTFVSDINTVTEVGDETSTSIATIIHLGTEFFAKILVIFLG